MWKYGWNAVWFRGVRGTIMGSHGSPQNMSIVMNRNKLNRNKSIYMNTWWIFNNSNLEHVDEIWSSLSALDVDPDFHSIGPDKLWR